MDCMLGRSKEAAKGRSLAMEPFKGLDTQIESENKVAARLAAALNGLQLLDRCCLELKKKESGKTFAYCIFHLRPIP
jgi:hypothetical protein